MTSPAQVPARPGDESETTADAIVIGAGFGGLSATYQLREAGLRVQAFEKGDDVGGTWYWNRYPGARTDSEASIYRLTAFDDLVGPWRFNERFPAQPEVLEYLRAVAEKLDLRPHYRFSTEVRRAEWDEAGARWHVTTDDGSEWVAKYLVTAAGIMSVPLKPEIAGLENFEGRIYHTADWPRDEDVDFTGQRVAVFGTGSSGIQVLPEVAKTAAEVTVFQRTPNYSVPMNNGPVTDADHADFTASLDQIRETVRHHPFSMPYAFSGRKALEVSDEERRSIYEEAWNKGGFRFMIESFDDIGMDIGANETASDFLRDKIREIVHDADTAEALCPSYPYTVKRPPSGTDFFKTFNQENVSLVDLRKTPLTHATENGLTTADGEREFDAIVFATGFDFLTGALNQIDFRGREGVTLKERWKDELDVYLSVAVNGFPNCFIIGGPLYPGGNWPTVAEQISQFVSKLVTRAERLGSDKVEVRAEVERAWVNHCYEIAEQTLMHAYGEEANSYGFGANQEGKLRAVHFYMGGANVVFDKFDEEEADGYAGFTFTRADGTPIEHAEITASEEDPALHVPETEPTAPTNV
jgi:cation diffusion facilitator CzcD-associated flavoprotein CzcO